MEEKDKMKQVKVLVLDFDNCILLDEETEQGSEEVKDEAWFKVYPEYNRDVLYPLLERFKKEIAGGKGDRKDIATKICKHFEFPEARISSEVDYRCERFNSAVQEGIKRIGVSQKTRDALTALYGRVPVYVNTGTPRDGALESLQALDLLTYFKEVYGRPGTKAGNLRDIAAAESVSLDEILFMDDQHSGWLAAQEVGCRFVGIHTARNYAWHNDDQPFKVIRLLSELLEMF